MHISPIFYVTMKVLDASDISKISRDFEKEKGPGRFIKFHVKGNRPLTAWYTMKETPDSSIYGYSVY